MADLANKTAIITGANSGIGLEAAVGLAAQGADVVLACRNPSKGAAAKTDVERRAGNGTVTLMSLDLASLESVRDFAHEVLAHSAHIDILLNNAGVVARERSLTVDGFEQTFGVNHLGHFLLTTLLLDRITATPGARIVTVASHAHKFARGGLDFDDLQTERGYKPMRVYGKSKLANIMFTHELARRIASTGATANSVHPGFVASNFGRNDPLGNFTMMLAKPFALSPAQGARTSIYVASDPGVAGVNGKYFYKCAAVEPTSFANDDAAARRLWDISETLVTRS
jgi:NAD(P)-dependent dehydrogenase (short-subunit alcohol dehydrogenase family)